MKMRKIIILLLTMTCLPAFAVTYENLNTPKVPAYRTGLSDDPEKEYIEAKAPVKIHQEYVKKDTEQFDISDLTYADLSIKQISREVASDLELDQETMVGDLSVLWQGAATQSDTINFALYKLANPEEDKPDEKSVKKSFDNYSKYVNLSRCRYGQPCNCSRFFNRGKCSGDYVTGH